jgi:hypothetical protein
MLRQDHRVDYVNDAIGRFDVRLNDLGAVERRIIAAGSAAMISGSIDDYAALWALPNRPEPNPTLKFRCLLPDAVDRDSHLW